MTWVTDQANVAAVSIGIAAPLRRGGIRHLTSEDQHAVRACIDTELLVAVRLGAGAVRFWGRRRAAAWTYLLDRRIGQLEGSSPAASGIANGRLMGSFRGTFAPGLITVVNHDNNTTAPPT